MRQKAGRKKYISIELRRIEEFFFLVQLLRKDETIISSISVTDIVFDVYLRKWNFRAIPEVKTWSYFLTIPKQRSKLKGKIRVGKKGKVRVDVLPKLTKML